MFPKTALGQKILGYFLCYDEGKHVAGEPFAMPELSSLEPIANMFSVDDYLFFYKDYLSAERSSAETAGVVDLMAMSHPMRVLDLACGFGRIANRLAMLGHHVTGIDLQDGFLEYARAEGRMNSLAVEYIQGDMRLLNDETVFDRVLMMFNSFGYFPDDENQMVLQNISRALKPGGRLGFDIANRDGTLGNARAHYVTEKDDALLINRFSFDVISGRLHNDRIILRDGTRRDCPFSIRLYSLTEMRTLLAQVGLVLESVYAEWDGAPLEMDSPAMVVIARKEA